MEQKKTRIEYIDIAKGITIFLVIVGHAANNLDMPFYRVVLYYFHMPLFFLLSGITLKAKAEYSWTTWKSIIRKNILVLMVPYFLWGLIYSQFSFVNMGRIVYGSWKSLTNAGTLTSLWYIPCLFIVRLEVHLLFQLFKKIHVNDRILAAGFAVISFVIGFLIPYIETPGYPWCIDISFVALGFVLLGYAGKDLFRKLSDLNWKYLVGGMLVGVLILALGTGFRMDDIELVLMCGHVYGDPLYFFINAFAGSAAILFLSMFSAKYNKFKLKPRLRTIGQSTFAIFILHKPILQKLVLGFFGIWGFDAYDFWIVALASLITLWICRWLTAVIMKYVPQLLGDFPAPQQKVVDTAETLS